jgi:hypothetical protein
VAGALLVAGVGWTLTRSTVPECDGERSIDGSCLTARYAAMTQTKGAVAALVDLDSTIASNQYARSMCHQLTHVIGRTAGSIHGKSAFAQGRDICASGYFHGVTEAVMLAIGPDRIRDQVQSVCSDERERGEGSYAHYNCVHGMGHGFMAVYDDDLTRSLAGCDALTREWEQRHCYGGVFMENLTSFGKSLDPRGSLRPEEPLFPCTAVTRRYKSECYIEQTAYALFVRNDDFAAVFVLCRTAADPDFRDVCYQGLGGDAAILASKYVTGDEARAATTRSLCMNGPDSTAQSNCIIGAVDTMIRDSSGDGTRAQALCATLDDHVMSTTCDAARIKAMRTVANDRPPHHH